MATRTNKTAKTTKTVAKPSFTIDQLDDNNKRVIQGEGDDAIMVQETVEMSDKLGKAGTAGQCVVKDLVVNADINPAGRLENAGGIEALAMNIFSSGQLSAIDVYQDGAKFVILRGHRRHAAFQHAIEHFGMPADTMININIVDKADANTSALDTLASNTGKHHSPLELGELFQRAKDAGASNAKIARTNDVSPALVTNWLMLHNLPSKVKAYVINGQCGPDLAVNSKRMIDKTKEHKDTTAEQKKQLQCVSVFAKAYVIAAERAGEAGTVKMTKPDFKAAVDAIMGVVPEVAEVKVDWPAVVEAALEMLDTDSEAYKYLGHNLDIHNGTASTDETEATADDEADDEAA